MLAKIQRPILRYHGGKWLLADWIITTFPRHKVYTEPFGGGGSILLRKAISDVEVYNDLWLEVVNVFRVLRDPVQAALLRELLFLTPYAKEELKLSAFASDDIIEQARRTLVRSWFSHSPETFVNPEKTRGFKSSIKRDHDPIKEWLPWQKHLESFTIRLRSVIIENNDALKIIQKYDSPETLHYVDPPYVHSTRDMSGRDGYAYEMNDSQHRELAYSLHNITGMCVLSGYRCTLYDELYSDWSFIQSKSVSNAGTDRTEVLWMNQAVTDKQSHKSLFDFF